MTIRVHPSIQRDDYQKQLQEINIFSQPSAIAPQALILNDAVSVTKITWVRKWLLLCARYFCTISSTIDFT